MQQELLMQQKLGLLQRIDSPTLENDVPVGLKDPNKEWYALTRRVRVMIANPKVVDVSKINDYTDLAESFFKRESMFKK